MHNEKILLLEILDIRDIIKLEGGECRQDYPSGAPSSVVVNGTRRFLAFLIPQMELFGGCSALLHVHNFEIGISCLQL